MIYIKTFNITGSFFNKASTDKEINNFCDSVNVIENGIKITNNGIMTIQYMAKDLGFRDEYHLEVLESNISNLKEKLIRAKINLIIATKRVDMHAGTDKERAENILQKEKCKHSVDAILNDIKVHEEVACELQERGLSSMLNVEFDDEIVDGIDR